MLEQVKYKNHLGEELNFSENGIYVKSSDLHDYAWSYTERGGKITSFKRGITNKKITLYINCDTESAGTAKKNQLMDICEKDIRAKQAGKLFIGDYYLMCYVTASAKSEYLQSKKSMTVALDLVTDYPYWIKEIIPTITTAENGAGQQFTNPLDYAANFIIEIAALGSVVPEGEAQIYIEDEQSANGAFYGITKPLEANDSLVINSLTKEIYIARNGSKINAFRDRVIWNNYVFSKIQPGVNHALSGGNYEWGIMLLDERSEPKWI